MVLSWYGDGAAYCGAFRRLIAGPHPQGRDSTRVDVAKLRVTLRGSKLGMFFYIGTSIVPIEPVA